MDRAFEIRSLRKDDRGFVLKDVSFSLARGKAE
jgi:hypothetical protein